MKAVIYLISESTIQEDDVGNNIPVPTERKVIADELAIFNK